MPNVSKSGGDKPTKPRPDFPLFPHASGRWAKKVRGKFVYFGKIADDPKGDAALERWLEEKEALLAGRMPVVPRDGYTIRDLLNRFLTSKQRLLDSSEITKRTFIDYKATAERISAYFGLTRYIDEVTPDEFEALRASIAKVRGPVALASEIQRIRIIFKYAFDSGLIDRPARYGTGFNPPSQKTLRLARNSKDKKLLTPEQLRVLIASAGVQLKAMILLGCNCGFGNHDVGTLPQSALDFKKAWVIYPRPKTGIMREIPLWPETIEAIRQAIEERPDAADEKHNDLVFITRRGQSWAKEIPDNPVSKAFAKELKVHGWHRRGFGFYMLRHIFETVGGETKDQVAVDAIMGHADTSMAGVYREDISKERLKAVTDHVRTWLFGKNPKKISRPKKV